MEENQKVKDTDAAGKKDSEEQHYEDDDSCAAMVLASLKHSKLDNETSIILEALKFKVLGQTKVNPYCNIQPELRISLQNAIRHLLTTPKILPRLPPVECLKGKIGRCGEPFEKQLTASDVNDHLQRLALNRNDVYAFRTLFNPEEDIENGLNVTTYDKEGREYQMHFKLWYPHNYVLIGEWKRFCHEHGLRAHEDWVTVWMFRHSYTDKPCFVITSRRLPIYTLIRRCRRGKLESRITKCRGIKAPGKEEVKDNIGNIMKQKKPKIYPK